MPAIHLAPFFVAAAGLFATGCASVPAGHSRSGTPLRSPYVLTAEEISGVNVNSAYEAVERLKPNFLTGLRGNPESVKRAVYLNGTRLLGGVENLRMIDAAVVEEIVFLTAIDASALYGGDNSAGALMVSTIPGAYGSVLQARTR